MGFFNLIHSYEMYNYKTHYITGYMLTCRGTISVKGKGDMVTYFLDAMAPKE